MYNSTHRLLVLTAFLLAIGVLFGSAGVAAQSADITVAQDGSGDYSVIQNAVDNATAGDRIAVAPGTYEQHTEISKTVTLYTSGATIANTSTVAANYNRIDIRSGFQIYGDAEPTISGFTFTDWRWSISAGGSEGDWSVTNVDINGGSCGVCAAGTPGNWTVTNSTIAVSDGEASISGYNSTGSWRVENSTISGGNLLASQSSGDAVIENTTFVDAPTGVSLDDTTGHWRILASTFRDLSEDGIEADGSQLGTIRETTITDTGDNGIDMEASEGTKLIANTTITNIGGRGIDLEDSTGGFTIKHTVISTTAEEGVDADGSTGTTMVSGLTVENTNDHGLDYESTYGNWTIEDTVIDNTADHGVSAYNQRHPSTGVIRNLTVTNTTNNGVNFYNSSGDLEISDTSISAAGGLGIQASSASGDWSVSNTTITDTSDSLVRARGITGAWQITNSRLLTKDTAVNATDSTEGNASYNYWEAADGPGGDFGGSGGAAVGNLTVDPYYTDSALTTLDQTATDDGFVDIDASDLSGSGTAADPYVITNSSELQAMEDDLDAFYELETDIEASGTAQWDDGAGFRPVGNSSAPFTGQFVGNQYNITHLTINRGSVEDVGLFGATGGSATVESVQLHSVNVTGKDDVGALVGDLEEESAVRSASASGTVAGKNNTGGLVGDVVDSRVVGSSATGSVTAADAAGGLVGSNVGGLVSQSSSQATVKATGEYTQGNARAGGLVGGNFNGAVINQSYAIGSVSGGKAGGITGENYDSSRVAHTYAAGEVSGNSRVTGGVVGENFKQCPFREQSSRCDTFGSSIVNDSYWDTQATGQSDSAGDAVGLATTQMTGEAARTNITELDFDTVWQTQPDDYPNLVAQSPQEGNESENNDAELPAAYDGTLTAAQFSAIDANTDNKLTLDELVSANIERINNDNQITGPDGTTAEVTLGDLVGANIVRINR